MRLPRHALADGGQDGPFDPEIAWPSAGVIAIGFSGSPSALSAAARRGSGSDRIWGASFRAAAAAFRAGPSGLAICEAAMLPAVAAAVAIAFAPSGAGAAPGTTGLK